MDIIRKIAQENNVSPNAVRREMNLAIFAAKSNPSTQEMWQKLFPDGKIPTAEEFIVAIASYIRKNKG